MMKVKATEVMSTMSAPYNDSFAAYENIFQHPAVRITFVILYSVVFTMCVVGNLIVLLVFTRSKRMRTRTNLFLANLAIADLCVGVFCVLPNLSMYMSQVWLLGQAMCKLYFFVHYMAYTASILLLVVIALERYIAIMHPLRSRGFFTAPRLFVAQGIVWGVAATYNIPILIMFDTESTEIGLFCFLSFPIINMTEFYTAHFVIWYVIPLLIIIFIYGRISCTLWTTSGGTRAKKVTQGSVTLPVEQNCLCDHKTCGKAHRGVGGGQTGGTCITYCDALGENDFAAAAKDCQGLNHGGSGTSLGGGLGEVPNGAKSGRSDPKGFIGSGTSLSRCGDGKVDRVNRSASRNGMLAYDDDKICTASHGHPSQDVNDHYEMIQLTSNADNYINILRNSDGNRKGKDSTTCHAQQQRNRVRGHSKHNVCDDYDCEASDLTSTDEYDSCRLRNNGDMHGSMDGASLYKDTHCIAGPKRLRYHCRISSKRGLASRRRVIRLLIGVVTVFVVCVVPYHVRNLLHYWQVNAVAGRMLDVMSPIVAFMMYLNSGLNPFIYWMFSDHFRQSLRETLCFWRRMNYNASMIAMNSPRQQKYTT